MPLHMRLHCMKTVVSSRFELITLSFRKTYFLETFQKLVNLIEVKPYKGQSWLKVLERYVKALIQV